MAFNQGDLKAMLIKVFIILVRLIGFSDDITLISSRTPLQGFTSSFFNWAFVFWMSEIAPEAEIVEKNNDNKGF